MRTFTILIFFTFVIDNNTSKQWHHRKLLDFQRPHWYSRTSPTDTIPSTGEYLDHLLLRLPSLPHMLPQLSILTLWEMWLFTEKFSVKRIDVKGVAKQTFKICKYEISQLCPIGSSNSWCPPPIIHTIMGGRYENFDDPIWRSWFIAYMKMESSVFFMSHPLSKVSSDWL